jgi:hypothetical protein
MDHFGLIRYTATAYGVPLATISEYCCLLDASGCFDGLSEAEAHTVATVLAVKICAQANRNPMGDASDAVTRSLRIAAQAW